MLAEMDVAALVDALSGVGLDDHADDLAAAVDADAQRHVLLDAAGRLDGVGDDEDELAATLRERAAALD